jgi:hypothetical protein
MPLIALTRMQSLADIVEWTPPDFRGITTLEPLLMAGLYVALSGAIRVSPMRALIVLALLHMTLQHRRHEIPLALVGVMICCAGMARPREAVIEPAGEAKRWYLPLVAVASAIIVLARVSVSPASNWLLPFVSVY